MLISRKLKVVDSKLMLHVKERCCRYFAWLLGGSRLLAFLISFFFITVDAQATACVHLGLSLGALKLMAG